MKFSDVPVGARFKSKFKATFIKFAESNNEEPNCLDISTYKLWFNLPETEVELVTKCVNCKYINKNSGELEVPIDGLKHYCHRIRADLSESHYGLDRDIETFSCSLFEMKD